jgi:metal-dependent amidase/aminoacylase/carboxypeptidase family protein
MAETFAAHLESLGRSAVLTDPDVGTGSTDMGDVSYAVPAIHPWLAICDRGEALCHQRRFAECAVSERGLDSMILAAKAMARTAAELLVDAGLRQSAKGFFDSTSTG